MDKLSYSSLSGSWQQTTSVLAMTRVGPWLVTSPEIPPITPLLCRNQSTVNKLVHSSTSHLDCLRCGRMYWQQFRPSRQFVILSHSTTSLTKLQTFHRERAPGSSLQRVCYRFVDIAPGTDYDIASLHLFNATSRFPFFDASDPQQMEVYWFVLVCTCTKSYVPLPLWHHDLRSSVGSEPENAFS
jgi:hypothetical protein